ncbi:MAG: queuosine precursor transporter [Synergistota bacterium]|nr:queuosine precursor transporter [Synergistota bacterium]
MSNEILWFAMMLLNFGCIMAIYRLWGKQGLLCWIPVSVILANIQVVKMVSLFGITSTLGNIVYASAFLVTDILSENHGKEDAKQAVYIGFFSLIAMTVIMNLALWFTPHPDDFAQGALETIFKLMPRLALASFMAYGASQLHDVWAFHWWKERTGGRLLWLRNNLSTMVSQALDSVIFTLVAFYGTVPTEVLGEIVLSTYVLKFIVAACDTPFVYWARKIGGKRK